jgi:restriction system protein
MAKPSPRKRGQLSRALLLKNGLSALVLGIGMLTASAVLGRSSPTKASVSTALSLPAWWAIGIGAALIFAHWLAFRRQGALERQALADSPPKAFTRPDPETILALIDQAERAFEFSHLDPEEDLATERDAPATRARRQRPGSRWGPAVFAAIEWRRFEAVCEALFAEAGFETRTQSHGVNGGVDIWLHQPKSPGPVAVVRCKHWQGEPVDTEELRHFLGLMASRGLKRGTYATTSDYTPEAEAFALANGIGALNAKELLSLIRQRTPEQQTSLLAIAFEGEYWRPTCPACGIKMDGRSRPTRGEAYWVCASSPACHQTISQRAGPLPH